MAATSPERAQELADLLARTGLGDRQAFSTLYQRTSAHLLGVILRIQRQRDLAEDILQEVYVNVWRSAAGFGGRIGLKDSLRVLHRWGGSGTGRGRAGSLAG